MYGLVIKRGMVEYAAVSPSKRRFKSWQAAIDKATKDVSAHECAWRLRDKTGWIDGSDNAERLIEDFPVGACVLW